MTMGWIGVDLDGTLAHYEGFIDEYHIGPPIPLMVERVKKWLEEGKDVRIFTARIHKQDFSVEYNIHQWCIEHIGQKLEVTNVKDYEMIELWDDRAIQVIANTGKRADEQ